MMVVAHNEFYLAGAVAGLHEGKASHSRKPFRGNGWGAPTQRAGEQGVSLGKEEDWRECYEST